MSPRTRSATRALALFSVSFSIAACTVGPDYARPPAPNSAVFKELKGWKPSDPKDGIDRGAWWSVYADPVLDGLEARVAVSNQNVAQAEANWRQAVALVQEARSAMLPVLTASPSLSRAGRGGMNGTAGAAATSSSMEAAASWDIDVWGKIRRQVEGQKAAAAVSAADLANATLSAQASLANAYFQMRSADSLQTLLSTTVAAYQRSLTIAQNQYAAGIVSRADVLSADAQLKSAQALLAAVGLSRAQNEHAIAILTGRPPAEVNIVPSPLSVQVPVVPPDVPSSLLERRPDIAGAERTMRQQNAQIGVATAAYYPDITLSAALGLAGSGPVGALFNSANLAWSLGGAAAGTLIDGGGRSASVSAARAGYDASVAAYRQTVLTAFGQVEDALSDLRVLQQQASAEDASEEAARKSADVTLNEYRAGTVAYTTVVTAQTQLLSAEQAALTVRQNRMLASVALIQALGGGWRDDGTPQKSAMR